MLETFGAGSPHINHFARFLIVPCELYMGAGLVKSSFRVMMETLEWTRLDDLEARGREVEEGKTGRISGCDDHGHGFWKQCLI